MNLSSFLVIQEVLNDKPFLMHIPLHASHKEAHEAALKFAQNILELEKQALEIKEKSEAAAAEAPAVN